MFSYVAGISLSEYIRRRRMTAARKSETSLNAYPRISFSIKVTGGENMRYRIETKDAIRMVGVRTPFIAIVVFIRIC